MLLDSLKDLSIAVSFRKEKIDVPSLSARGLIMRIDPCGETPLESFLLGIMLVLIVRHLNTPKTSLTQTNKK
jgi:hypothetical protein